MLNVALDFPLHSNSTRNFSIPLARGRLLEETDMLGGKISFVSVTALSRILIFTWMAQRLFISSTSKMKRRGLSKA